MKNIAKTICLFLISMSAMAAQERGGGIGVECREEGGSKSLVTLDYYEAKVRGMRFSVRPDSRELVTAHVLKRFEEHYGVLKNAPHRQMAELENVLNWAGRNEWRIEKFFDGKSYATHGGIKIEFQMLPLRRTQDYGWIVGPYLQYNPKTLEPKSVLAPNCRLVQIAVFFPGRFQWQSVLKVNKPLFERLDWLNKALLFTHEQVYSLDRKQISILSMAYNEQPVDSWWSRYFTAKLLSDEPPTTRDFGIPADFKGTYFCKSQDPERGFVGYMYESEFWKDQLEFTLFKAGNHYSNYWMYARFSKAPISQVLDPQQPLDIKVELSTGGPGTDAIVALKREAGSQELKVSLIRKSTGEVLFAPEELNCRLINND